MAVHIFSSQPALCSKTPNVYRPLMPASLYHCRTDAMSWSLCTAAETMYAYGKKVGRLDVVYGNEQVQHIHCCFAPYPGYRYSYTMILWKVVTKGNNESSNGSLTSYHNNFGRGPLPRMGAVSAKLVQNHQQEICPLYHSCGIRIVRRLSIFSDLPYTRRVVPTHSRLVEP
jgi:hypothetical protein